MGLVSASSPYEKYNSFDYEKVGKQQDTSKDISYSYKPTEVEAAEEEQTEYLYSYNPGYKFEEEEPVTEY